MVKELMTQYRDIQARIASADKELFAKVQPYAHLVEKLDEIPGIDVILAMGIIAEATTDTSAFRDERTFAAWAGVAPGNNESAGKKKHTENEKRPGLSHSPPPSFSLFCVTMRLSALVSTHT